MHILSLPDRLCISWTNFYFRGIYKLSMQVQVCTRVCVCACTCVCGSRGTGSCNLNACKGWCPFIAYVKKMHLVTLPQNNSKCTWYAFKFTWNLIIYESTKNDGGWKPKKYGKVVKGTGTVFGGGGGVLCYLWTLYSKTLWWDLESMTAWQYQAIYQPFNIGTPSTQRLWQTTSLGHSDMACVRNSTVYPS